MRRLLFVGIVLLLAGCELPGNDHDLRVARNADEAAAALAAGADIEASDPFGSTPLIYAARFGRADVVAFLVAHGAKIDARNSVGETALSLAEENGYPAIAALLKSREPGPGAAEPQGCLGQPVTRCVAGLRAAFVPELEPDIAGQMARNAAVDVNGRPLGGRRLVTIGGRIGGAGAVEVLSLEYDAAGNVDAIEVSLWDDPYYAKTEADFEATGLFEAVSLLVGPHCKGLDRQTVYRFFYNTVRPQVIEDPKHGEVGDTHAAVRYFRHAAEIPFCGARFSYEHLLQLDTDDITRRNPHGASGVTIVGFRRS